MDRSDAELMQWAHEHLVYEACMLAHAVDKFANKGPSDQDHNAFMESFAIHVRCLTEFLWGRRAQRHPEDAFASDFCDPGVWETGRPPLPAVLEAIEGDRQRIGREVVHLTYHRLDINAEAKDWDLSALKRAITEGLHEFAKLAKPERLHQRTREALALAPTDYRVIIASDDESESSAVAVSIPVTGGTIAFDGFTVDSIGLHVD